MQKTGFTLIELMVVITIIALLSILSYAPYNYYSNIAKVRFSSQKVEQAVSEVKSSVIGGFSLSGAVIGPRQNVHMALVFSGGADTIEVRGYSFTSGTGDIATTNTGEIIRNIPLESGVSIAPDSNGIALFLSPNSEIWTSSGTNASFQKNIPLKIDVSYKKATPGSLRKTITIQ